MTKTFEQIRTDVIKAGGIKCFRMETLRDASPYRRLGPGVNAEIHEELEKKGLVHTELPLDAWRTVYVVDGHSPVGELLRIIQGTPTDDGAASILKSVQPADGASAADAQLKEVKAVLVQLQDIFSQDDDVGGAD
jgi:hypothetical protein